MKDQVVHIQLEAKETKQKQQKKTKTHTTRNTPHIAHSEFHIKMNRDER